MNYTHLAAQLLARPDFEVVALIDPNVEQGIGADTDQAIFILCPILGPSATVILHRLSRYAADAPTTWTPVEFARTFGLASTESIGKASRAVARLAQFGFAVIRDDALAVRTKVPPLPHRWTRQLPEYLRSQLNTAAA